MALCAQGERKLSNDGYATQSVLRIRPAYVGTSLLYFSLLAVRNWSISFRLTCDCFDMLRVVRVVQLVGFCSEKRLQLRHYPLYGDKYQRNKAGDSARVCARNRR